jgi:hypothetical protein
VTLAPNTSVDTCSIFVHEGLTTGDRQVHDCNSKTDHSPENSYICLSYIVEHRGGLPHFQQQFIFSCPPMWMSGRMSTFLRRCREVLFLQLQDLRKMHKTIILGKVKNTTFSFWSRSRRSCELGCMMTCISISPSCIASASFLWFCSAFRVFH